MPHKPWTAESQIKQGFRRYKNSEQDIFASQEFTQKLLPLTLTFQYKQTNKQNSEKMYSLFELFNLSKFMTSMLRNGKKVTT